METWYVLLKLFNATGLESQIADEDLDLANGERFAPPSSLPQSPAMLAQAIGESFKTTMTNNRHIINDRGQSSTLSLQLWLGWDGEHDHSQRK
jgi:hypothetical protein